jgi:cell division protein ZapA (FtsZ GTPase activity inhibitor)
MANKKGFVDKQAFLSKAQNLRRVGMEIEGIGLVGVRELNGKQLLAYNERIRQMKQRDPEVNTSNALELLALLVSMSVCDDEGNLLFTEQDVQDLQEVSSDTLIKISAKALELSGLAEEKVTEATDSLKKAMSESSTTVSPRNSESQ